MDPNHCAGCGTPVRNDESRFEHRGVSLCLNCTESYVSWLLDGEPDEDGERAATYAQWGFDGD